VTDDFSRQNLALEAERRMTTIETTRVPDRLVIERGAPTFIRSDTGPEFVARGDGVDH
jgi:putative transposase